MDTGLRTFECYIGAEEGIDSCDSVAGSREKATEVGSYKYSLRDVSLVPPPPISPVRLCLPRVSRAFQKECHQLGTKCSSVGDASDSNCSTQ